MTDRGKPGPAPRDPALVRSTPIKTLLTGAEADALLNEAKTRGQTASTLIRALILAELSSA